MKVFVFIKDEAKAVVQPKSTDTLAQLKQAIATKFGFSFNEDIIFYTLN